MKTINTETEIKNIIGEDLSKLIEERGVDNKSIYLVIYVSMLIKQYIEERTQKNLYKEYNEDNPTEYDLYIGLKLDYSLKLNDEMIKAIKVACIYQLDYILENGSAERMSGISINARGMVLDKKALNQFKICDMAHTQLVNKGIIYSGLGGGVNAWIK
jgi:hypothetical protein